MRARTETATTSRPPRRRRRCRRPEPRGSRTSPNSPPRQPIRPPRLRSSRAALRPTIAREPNAVDWSGGDPARGQALYATHCAICHGGGGAGDGVATPALNPKPRDFRDARFYIDGNANNQTGEDVDLARVILHGPAAFGGTNEMVAWRDAFSDQDVRDLIAHIRTLAAPTPATPAGTS